MPKLLLIWPWMFAAALAAQQGSAPDLPRLTKLGPMPATAKVVQVGADALVRDGANKPIDLAELVLAVAGPSAPVLLRVDRLAPAAIVGSVLEVCADWGVSTVQFAAMLLGSCEGLVPPPQRHARLGIGGRYSGPHQRPRAWSPAITNALAWLQQQQHDDGSLASTSAAGDVDATALAVLAWLADDLPQTQDTRQQSISRGLDWLLTQQGSNGRIGDDISRHAHATFALAVACRRPESKPALRAATASALAWLLAQQQTDGGFACQGEHADTITTAACALALRAAQESGFDPRDSLAKTAAWLDLVADADTGAHRLHAMPAAGDLPQLTIATAAGLFTRLDLGQQPKRVPMLRRSAALLQQIDLDEPWRACWTAWALFFHGGEAWARGSRQFLHLTTTPSRQSGCAGSWDPPPGGSRTVTTALRTLSLETYYRSMRLWR